ncbi:hypothetical protein D3C78_1920870 [compost metagenome]
MGEFVQAFHHLHGQGGDPFQCVQITLADRHLSQGFNPSSLGAFARQPVKQVTLGVFSEHRRAIKHSIGHLSLPLKLLITPNL